MTVPHYRIRTQHDLGPAAPLEIHREGERLGPSLATLKATSSLPSHFSKKLLVPWVARRPADGDILAEFEIGGERLPAVTAAQDKVTFHFDPFETIGRLLDEQYVKARRPIHSYLPVHYHRVPGRLRLLAFRLLASAGRRERLTPGFPEWPLDDSVDVLRRLIVSVLSRVDSRWGGRESPWPDGKRFAVTITHDVDTAEGVRNIPRFAEYEEERGLTSCWNIVARGYPSDGGLLEGLLSRGHEVGIHGYNHDNRLAYLPTHLVRQRLRACVEELGPYRPLGFRSPSFLTTPRLLRLLSEYVEYDSSVPDTDLVSLVAPRRGCCTLFPFLCGRLVELPATLPPEDKLLTTGYAPEQILRLWIAKIERIREAGGLAVVTTHLEPHHYATAEMREAYRELLAYLARQSEAWIANPGKISRWWRDRVLGTPM